MSEIIKKNTWTVALVLICSLIALAYAFTAKPIYSAKAQVAVLRQKMDDNERPNEEVRNRWVWIRDGLGTQSAIITDDLIKSLIEKNPELNKLTETEVGQFAKHEAIRKMINIQFTGADEFNFHVEVKTPNPKLSLELTTAVYQRIKHLMIKERQEQFNESLNQIVSKAENYGPKSDEFGFFQDKIKKFIFEQSLQQSQREKNFITVIAPSLLEKPVWPKKKFILLAGIMIGLVLGLSIQMLVSNKK